MKWFRYIFIIPILISCEPSFIIDDVLPISEYSSTTAQDWLTLELEVIKDAQPNSPTYASRSLAYLGLAMYESTVYGSEKYQSIAKEIGAKGIPKASGLDWEVTLSVSQQEMLKYLYPGMSDKHKAKMQGLITELKKLKAETDDKTIAISEKFGEKVANELIKKAKTDGGASKRHKILDEDYSLPQGLKYWVPPFGGQFSEPGSMHPYWGQNQPFVSSNTGIAIPKILEYSSDSSSAYFKEMKLVYEKNISLTLEEKETAAWWGDDPTVTASPPGHAMYLAMVLAKTNGSDLFETTLALAQVGMATADAFIITWECKYKYHSQRPTSYIRQNIDEVYWQFWPEPPFPAFVSGHSSQIAAAVTVLQSIYGDKNTITDDFHKWREFDVVHNVGFKPRNYESLWKIAEECGWSRILGGIHMPQDNIEGLKLGKGIGHNVANLGWNN